VAARPTGQVQAFAEYEKNPQGVWRKPAALLSLGEARLERPAANGAAHEDFLRGMLTVAAGAAGLLLGALLLRRLAQRLRSIRLPRLPALKLPRFKLPALPALRRQPAEALAVAGADGASSVEQEIQRLRAMLNEKPWRSDIRYQLAQRLYKARDAEGFGQIAPRLKAALNEEAWLRVRAMGRELRPGDPAYQF
jgi:hypothetical protein